MKKFIKFLLGGGISYLIKLILTFILTNMFNVWYLLSYSITMTMIIIYGFFYNFYFTFKNVKNKKNKFIIYMISVIGFALIDIFLVKILTDELNLYYLKSIIISTSALIIFKYLFYNMFVFLDYKEKGGNYYDKHNSKNPIVKWLLSNFHNIILNMIKESNTNNLLDIGCGEGYTTNTIKNKFPNIKITAREYDYETVLKSNIIHNNLNIKKGDIYNLKFKDNFFDMVLSSEVLEHLEQPNLAIKECKRVSKKYCLYSVPNEPWWRIVNMMRLAYLPRFGNTPGHINHWTKTGLKKMLKKHFKHVVVKRAILWNVALCWD